MDVGGLASKLCEPDFVRYIKSFDIFFAVDTFTHFQFDSSIHFFDYVVFHSPAQKKKKRKKKKSKPGRRPRGVVVLMYKTAMSFVTHIKCEHDNMICFKLAEDVVGSDVDLLIISVYVPPYLSPYYRQTDTNCHIHCLEEVLLSLYERDESSHCLIIDDFNAVI